jgi:hypothetical protein
MDAPILELKTAMASYVPPFFTETNSLSINRLYNSGMYSDLTIVCGGKRYAVHRALLTTRSSFFEGACRNTFLEAATGVIDLSEDDTEAVEHMVHCKHDSWLSCTGMIF